MSFTQSDLNSINTAIASGELTVSVQGRTVTYRSMDDLLKARTLIETDLATQRPGGSIRTGHFRFTTARGM